MNDDAVATSQAEVTAAPVTTLLSEMQGQTVTEGWDVVSAMDAERINDLLGQQYVANVAGGETLDPINATVPVIGSTSVQFIDLTLGPPLITFSPTLAPQEAYLSLSFVSGTVNVVQTSGQVTTVLSTQIVTPEDNYALTGVVPLASVKGVIENQHDVVIDITNGVSFAAHLGIAGGAETTLGEYFLQLIQKNASKFSYSLGSLIYDPSTTNLTPINFDFATQVDETDKSDTGRLVLFVATTYNPNGGSQTALPIANVVPDGFSTALIVSSKALFQSILLPSYQSQFSPYGLTVQATQANPSSAYALSVSGSANIGVVKDTPTWSADFYFSGVANSDISATQEPVSVPLSGLTIAPRNNNVVVAMNNGWGQGWVHGFPVPRVGIGYDGGTVNMTASINDQNSGSVDPVKDTVTFTGDISVSVSFDQSSIWAKIFGDGSASDRVGADVQSATQNLLQNLLNFALPQVNAFAVSNLLFPQEHILSFRAVYVPGDLLILGDVQTSSVLTSPLFATLTSGQTQQFTATLPSTDTQGVTWSISPQIGAISTNGLYTAPATVTTDTSVVVTATSKADSSNTSSAIITLVLNDVQVSPVFALITPNTQPQQFSAAVAGSGSQAVTWAMNPQMGTLSTSGLYTPPSSVAEPTAVTITATSTANAKISGNATVILMATGPNGVAVSPPSLASPLTPLQSQQFSATVQGTSDQGVTWSVVPPVGTISTTGLYRAPSQISTPQTVVVVATSVLTSVLYGTAVVLLAPSGS